MGRGLVVGMLVLAATVTGAFSGVRPGLAAAGREDHMRAEIAQLLNGERAQRGLGQLPVDAGLAQSAQAWAERNRSVGCEPPTDCHSPDAEAEILAWGGPEAKSGAIVVAWMQSSVHRDILLHGRANAVGVGFACSEDGTVYAAVQFGGVRKPVPATTENPIASAPSQGSACRGSAAPLSQTAPPTTTTTSTTAPPATTAPPRPPATTTPRPRPVATTAPAPPVVAVPVTAAPAAPAATTTTAAAPPTTTSAPPRVGLANAPFGDDEGLLYVSDASAPGPPAESAFVFMLVVVVFLSVLRVGFQLRDNADARSEESVRPAGL